MRAFLTDECLCRYLRAREWKLKPAEKLIRGTVQWRAEYRVEDITPDDIYEREQAQTLCSLVVEVRFLRGHCLVLTFFLVTSPGCLTEGMSGKNYLHGFDRAGRPVIYQRPRRENSKKYDDQVCATACARRRWRRKKGFVRLC